VRQGGPIGPILFSLALHGPLEQLTADFAHVRVVAYADDCYLQGPAEVVTAAYAAFRDALLPIGLEIVPGKSCAYSEDSDAAALVAQTVGIPHAATGFVAAGTPSARTPSWRATCRRCWTRRNRSSLLSVNSSCRRRTA
jgi:Reverse transcriptase (RNA-dependent DNA polymerase)